MEHPVLRAATVPLMLLVGALITLQSRVNASLAGQLGDGLRAGALAAVVSFGSGLLLLSAVVLSHPRRRAGLRRVLDALRDPDAGGDRPRLRPVHLLGGLGGAFFVASQGIAVGVIGVALFIVAFTAGQSVASLVVDHVGLGPGGHEPVSRPRAVAALFAVAAVTVKVLGDLDGSHLGLSLLLASLALVAGCLQAVQQAFNGKISAVGGPLVTTWNNFLVGTSALLVSDRSDLSSTPDLPLEVGFAATMTEPTVTGVPCWPDLSKRYQRVIYWPSTTGHRTWLIWQTTDGISRRRCCGLRPTRTFLNFVET